MWGADPDPPATGSTGSSDSIGAGSSTDGSAEAAETAPTTDVADIAALEALTLQNPPAELDEDPYTSEPPGLPPDLVCGVLVDGEAYSLQTYDDQAAAQSDGVIVTHPGTCGRCSPLSDLAVYMRQGDLTGPVRECGVLGLTQGDDANLQCPLDLGSSVPCAQIWLYNTINTRDACFDECIDALDEPYHRPTAPSIRA